MDKGVMKHLRRKLDNSSFECEFCGHPFPWSVTIKKFSSHLSGVQGSISRITICPSVPENVREAAVVQVGQTRPRRTREEVVQKRVVEAECSRVEGNWELTRILDESKNNVNNVEAQTGKEAEVEEEVEAEVSSVQRTLEERGGFLVGDLRDQREVNVPNNKRQRAMPDALPSVASSSATICEARPYVVFLSFRGEDTRNGFTSHLHQALSDSQISTFIDNKLERGDNISPALLTVIEESTISLIIFSENYADSRWCLKELAKIIQCKHLNGQIVIPVFYGVDPSHVRKQRGKFGVAFDKLKERLQEGEMDLNEVRSHLEEAANISGWSSHDIRLESELIKSIVQDILKKLKQRREVEAAECSRSPTKRPVGDAFGSNVEKICSWLMDNQVLRVGIYGMGGVGKTTLMRHIQTRLEGERSFKVYWVSLSQDFSIWKLQDLIAKKIDLKFLDKEDEEERAKSLAQTLKGKGRCVLILDDLWNDVELDEVGIPVGVNTCKLVLTTRSLEVCQQMDCSTIQVQPLSEEEAWILFTQELGNYNTKVEELVKLVKAVSRECAGLPLGITVMARSMKGNSKVHAWRNTLVELKESKVSKGHKMQEKVFSVLKFSYLHLNDPALQDCLSYCALFPEDEKIGRNVLIRYMIVEGIIDERNRQAELDKGHTMLDTLENACLLEGDNEVVWMHDLIRDMVIHELRERTNTLVEAGLQLKELPDVEKWTEDLVRVSLIENEIEVILYGHTPRCPNLSTLLLCRNKRLKRIRDSFFEQFQKLKVLDLSGCEVIQVLPGSISNLVNLTALLLAGCRRLRYVPSLVKLEKLKMLDLRGCVRLKEMPEGVKFLPKLNYLDLFRAGMEDGESEISKFVGWEVGELRMLETLYCDFRNLKEFGEYIESQERSQQSLSHYNFFIGKKYLEFKTATLKSVSIDQISFIDPLRLPTDIEELSIEDCGSTFYKRLFPPSILSCLINLQEIRVTHWDDIEEIFAVKEDNINTALVQFTFSYQSTHSLSNHSLLNLKVIVIWGCNKLKKLFPPSLLPNLHNLQQIRVYFCYGMEEIFSTDQEDGQELSFGQSINNNHYPPNPASTSTVSTGLNLPKLTKLELFNLPELRSVYNGAINCRSLQEIQLSNCPKMERITLPLPQPSLRRIRVYPKEWWESVQWGSANDKIHLQPLCESTILW